MLNLHKLSIDYAEIVKKRLNIFPILLFTGIFLINYSYYLFHFPIPGFSNDAIQYFYSAFQIIDGNLPISNMPVDIPLGYSLFLSIFILLKLDIVIIVYVQICIMFAVSLFLLVEVKKINFYAGLIYAILLGVWICDPNVMNHNTYFYPDSLFSSSIVFIIAFYLRYLRKKDFFSLFGISVGFIIGISLRSNGVYLTFIIILLLFALLKDKKYKIAMSFAGSTLMLLLVLSTINYLLKDSFFPGDYNRIKIVVKRIFTSEDEYFYKLNQDSTIAPLSRDSRIVIFNDYLFNMRYNRPSFYYSHLNYNKIKYDNIKLEIDKELDDNEEYIHFRSVENASLDIAYIAARIYSNHNYKSYVDADIEKIIDCSYRPRNKTVYTTHVIYSSYYYLLCKFGIPVILFILAGIVQLFCIFKRKRFHKAWQYILIISCFHWLSILLITFAHDRVQSRYVIVTEFVLYLTIVLSGIQLFSKKPIFK